MGASLAKLDKSGWTSEQLARLARMEEDKRQYRVWSKAKAAHPLADGLEGLSDAALGASRAARLRMKAIEWDNGHREVTIWREQPEMERTLERAIERDCKAHAPRGFGDREQSTQASVRRAKQRVRLLCKSMIVNSLWTLTYRANVTDRELVLKHLDAFRRRTEKVLGEWKYIAVLEKQGRGAYHVHIATHALPERLVAGGVRVKSWDVMRAIWRRITGELGGNFDESKRGSRWSKRRKPIRGAGNIARYIAGYVAKDMLESPINRKRYSRSTGIEVPEAYRALWPADTPMAELIELAYAGLGSNITGVWWDSEREVFYAESDDSRFAERSRPVLLR